MTGNLAHAFPILPSPDTAATRAFYTDQLGFTAVGPESDDRLIVRRDAMELHFWRCNDPELPRVTSCYIRGGQIARLYEEFSGRAVQGLSAFELRPWNMKEFYIHDPHGNLLRFGCRPEDA